MKSRLFFYITFLAVLTSSTNVYASNFNWAGSRIGYIATSSLPKESLSWDNFKNWDTFKKKLPMKHGGLLGYNFTVGDLVIGPEATVEFVNDMGVFLRSNFNLKLAYAFDRLSPFITAGYSHNFTIFRLATDGGVDIPSTFDDTISARGYNVGAGLDLGLVFGSALRVAYNYRFLNDGDKTENTHAVMLGLIF
ncbi:outer membrane protein [Bartonella sp. DGB1]|uniref:outer membrane protein n=1 Tax=Bartonella sp. DGB1 TaxID=3239807 RepID=UPI0035260C96